MNQSSARPAFWRAVAGVGGDELHAAGTWQNLDRLSLLAPPSFVLHPWTSLLQKYPHGASSSAMQSKPKQSKHLEGIRMQ